MPEFEINELKGLALCHACVKEPYLSNEIKVRDESRECAYCNEMAPSIALGELAKRINGVFDQHFVRTTDDSPYGSEGDGEPVVAAIADAAEIPEIVAQDIQRILEEEHSDFDSMTMGEETEFANGSYYEEKETDIQGWWQEWTCFEKSLKTEARFFNGSAARTLNLVFAGIDSMRTDDKPALGIVAHTRKPQTGERRNGGTGLMHALSGSYVLTSVPRCIWIVVRGSEDETDDGVVVFNPKNSNGKNSPRSAWVRRNGLFAPLSDFDWNQFDKPPETRRTVTADDVEAILRDKGTVPRSEAVERLMEQTELKKSACFNALKIDGPFGQLFTLGAGGYQWR